MKFFVSYSRSVQDKVREIIASLRDDGEDVWWDQDLRAGQDWWATILNKIEASEVCLFMISEKAVQSPYCMEELRYALVRNRLVLPFVLDAPATYTIPPEIMRGRIQYELYDGVPGQLKDRILLTCKGINWAQYKDRFAVRPPEPNTGSSNLADRLAKSIALAQEGVFEAAIDGFNDVAHNDHATFGDFCHTWIEKINRYKEVASLSTHPSMKRLALPRWEAFLKQYVADEPFDPLGVQEKITQSFGQPNTTMRESVPTSGDEQNVRDLLKQMQSAKDWSKREPLIKAIVNIGAPAITLLLPALNDNNENVRCCVTTALGELQDERAVKPLIAALRDKSDEVRYYAASALSKLRAVGAVEPLIAALQDPSKKVRRYASDALGVLGDRRAVKPLVALLSDNEAVVRVSVVFALGILGDVQAYEPLLPLLQDIDEGVRRYTAVALDKLRDQHDLPASSVSTLPSAELQRVYTLIEEVRKAHIEDLPFGADPYLYALGDMGEVAVIPILSLLRDADAKMRESAVNLLGNIGDDRAIEPLIEMLQDPVWDVRWAACHMLARFEDKRTIEPLIERLKDPQPEVRDMAAAALVVFEDARAVEPLIVVLQDEDEKVRMAAARALGELGGQRAVEGLTQALDDENKKVRETAQAALSKLAALEASAAEQRARDLLEQLRNTNSHQTQDSLRQEIRSIGIPAVMPLVMALKESTDEIKRFAADTLGKLGDKRALEPLIATLKHTNHDVRQFAAEGLGKLGDVRAVEPLILALQDNDIDVKRAAARSLGDLGDKRAVAPLIVALRDKDEDVRGSVARILGKLGDTSAVPALNQALNDESEFVRMRAQEALEDIKGT